MRDLIILLVHVITTLARLMGQGGVRSVVAESALVKQQLLILNRSRQRASKLRASDRFVAGLCALFMRPTRLIRSAIVLKPSTLLGLHHALIRRKYRVLFSQKRLRRPGPEGPSREVINAIVDMKQRNLSLPIISSRLKTQWLCGLGDRDRGARRIRPSSSPGCTSSSGRVPESLDSV